MVRSAGRIRMRMNSVSHSATPRIRMMPRTAENSPRMAARTRSWVTRTALSGATTPRSAGSTERATKWCAERASNPGGGAASDENAKVATAQPKRHADTRGDAAGKLRITRFQTDGRAHPARPHRLGGDDYASQQRHATAVQGVSFDRIDFPFRTPSPDNFAGDPE